MQDAARSPPPTIDEATAQSPHDANAPFVRLWQGFLTGRVLIATALLLLQLALLSVQPGGNPLVWLVCLGYLGLTLLVRLTAREQPPSARAGVHWLPVIGVDIAAICLLQVLQTGPLNYSALLAIPILISAVLGNLTLALATTASVTLLTLGWVAWQDLAGRIESTQAYYQASFACAGYFAVAYLTHELARRVRRERHLAQHSSRKAQAQEQVNALVIRHLGEGVLVVDPQFRVQQANPAALHLLGLADAHALPFALKEHAGWQRLQDAVAQSFAQNLPISAAIHLQSIGQEGMTGLHLRTWLTEVATPSDATDAAEPALLQQLCVVFLHDLRELEARLRTESWPPWAACPPPWPMRSAIRWPPSPRPTPCWQKIWRRTRPSSSCAASWARTPSGWRAPSRTCSTSRGPSSTLARPTPACWTWTSMWPRPARSGRPRASLRAASSCCWTRAQGPWCSTASTCAASW